MSWQGHLSLNYSHDGERTVALDRHTGPLRVLQRLYPESPQVCHHVLVHPPGGLVGGDRLELQAHLAPGSHALITTPGATRFYKSAGDEACQHLIASVGESARLEWLPLETIAYPGCRGHNDLRFELAPSAEMMGWDMLALGLPATGQPFERAVAPASWFTQCVELPGVWLEKGTIRADDARLLDSPLGWAGCRVLGSLWFARGAGLDKTRREGLLDAAREQIGQAASAGLHGGATATHEDVIVVRVLGARVEPVTQLLTSIWARWRPLAWDLAPCPPRVWRT